MEKIYEEKNNVKEKKRIKMDGTVILSFAVALIAIASLITVGFKQISYAALTDVEMPVGDAFLGKNSEYTIVGNGFPVEPYYAVIDDGAKTFSVFCLERNINFINDGWYTKDDYVVEDGGLLYLLANLHPNGKLYKEDNTEIDSDAAIWITQTAVWFYMSEKNLGANSKFIADGEKEKVKAATSIVSEKTGSFVFEAPMKADGTGQATVYDSVYVKPNGGPPITINQLIEKAKNDIKGPGVDFSVNGGNDIKIKSVSEDGKYYVSEMINVQGKPADTSIGEFKSFSLNIDSAPEGTVIIDQNGTPLTKEQMNNIAAGTKLYVRVPTDKVTEENKVAQFTARGHFDTFVGYGYRALTYNSAEGEKVDGESQRITLVDKVSNTHKKEFKINLDYVPDVPDTGMNTAQSIYFIGLVVLLCGIGIVYANAKPATNKQ